MGKGTGRVTLAQPIILAATGLGVPAAAENPVAEGPVAGRKAA